MSGAAAGEPVALDDATRAGLAAIADLLIPADGDLPAASEVDTTGRYVDRIIAADPSLLGPLTALAGCATWDDVEAFQARDAATFEAAAFGLVSAYCMHPRVRKRMGYPGQGPSPILADEPEWYMRDGILDPVRERGPIYVPTPRG